MKRVLYIGERDKFAGELAQIKGVELLHVKNVVGFYNRLESIINTDLIIAEYKLKGLYGGDIYDRYKDILNEHRIPYSLIDDDLALTNRKNYLRQGIIELFEPDFPAEKIVSRIDFLKQMHKARLEKIYKKHEHEYKIPLSKRIFDLVTAGLALIILSPFLIITALAIRLESRGPIFYISKRVGTGYKVFDFYKFRSMYADADKRLAEMKHLNQYNQNQEVSVVEEKHREEFQMLKGSPTLIHKDGTPMTEEEYYELRKKQQAGTFVKFKNDPRVTKVGKFIRNTSIDELPQLFNVLKGDMSIVGNRPLPLYEAEQLTSDDWGERFLAPAGITGLWQVEKRGKGKMSEEERKALDNEYAKNFSFWNDIRLIMKTIPALFQKENV